MVVKVISLGPDESVKKHIVCFSCGAKLEYIPIGPWTTKRWYTK